MSSTPFRIALQLLAPSFLSGVVCVTLALLVLGLATVSYVQENQLFYEYFFGQFGVATALLTTPDGLSNWQNAIGRSPVAYVGLAVAIAAIAGLLVFVILQAITASVKEIAIIRRAIRENSSYSHEVLREIILHTAARIASIVAWGFYCALFIGVIFPFCTFKLQAGIELINNGSLAGWADILWSALLLVTSLHVHVTMVRVSFLRLRLFS